MTFLECFVDDPLPSPEDAGYDVIGPAAWVGPDLRPRHGHYDPSNRLCLYEMTPEQLEALAAEIICAWGDPRANPEFSARHLYHEGRHNLFLFKIRRVSDLN